MATFEAYIPILTTAEGGFQKLKGDKGNYNSKGQLVGTNYGISAPVYEKWIGYVPTENDMRAITKTIALEIMKAWYWDKISASSINNQSIANILADHAVNAGPGAAGKLVQEVLNENFGFNLKIDGKVGANTLFAINNADESELHQSIKQARENEYERIGGEFLKTWLNRLQLFVFEKKKPSDYLV